MSNCWYHIEDPCCDAKHSVIKTQYSNVDQSPYNRKCMCCMYYFKRRPNCSILIVLAVSRLSWMSRIVDNLIFISCLFAQASNNVIGLHSYYGLLGRRFRFIFTFRDNIVRASIENVLALLIILNWQDLKSWNKRKKVFPQLFFSQGIA